MHLVFERSNGRFKSNCNVLTLAWVPYYDENKFKSALFDYHQRQLIDLTGSIADNSQHHLEEHRSGRASAPLGRAHRYHQSNSRRSDDAGGSAATHRRSSQMLAATNQTSRRGVNNNPAGRYLNARIAEFSQRHGYVDGPGLHPTSNTGTRAASKSGQEIEAELDAKYGLMEDFGWLAVGNVGKMVGITLSSIVRPQRSPMTRRDENLEEDLIDFNEDINNATSSSHTMDELLLTGIDNSFLGQDLKQTTERPDRDSVRTNYNLRGHLDEVIIVKWNELYQKLASVDIKGNVLIWCKVNGKFTIQTPFYNRTKTVADFKWSHDGKIALICYTDSFILVGSSSGQRHWHSMLNLDDYHITSASWTPNDDQLLLGVSNGNVLVIDLFRSDLTELEISQSHVRTMCWSTDELSFRYLKDKQSAFTEEETTGSGDGGGMATLAGMYNTVVNHRRLSRDCSVFSRYRFCSQGPTQTMLQSLTTSQHPVNQLLRQSTVEEQNTSSQTTFDDRNKNQRNILALDFANNTIKLYSGGLSDPKPRTIQVNQESYIMQWSSSGRMLAVAGFNIHTTAPSIGYLKCKYLNAIKFYDQEGHLIYEYAMEYTRYPITALTWAHGDSRLFVATGPRIHQAKVFLGIPSLSLLAQSSIHKNTMLPEKYDILNNKINYQMQMYHQVWYWQSKCCPINLMKYFRSNHSEKTLNSWKQEDSSWTCSGAKLICNNINIFRYQLPLKLQLDVDHLFLPTIRPPFDEHWSLSDIIWHVPNEEKRYYCTLVCYSSERELTSMGQYRMSSINRQPDNQAAKQDQNKIFVLYVEFQGSLIPILRARRVGFLKPEFVIFNPEDQTAKERKYRKVSDLSQILHNDTMPQQRKSLRPEHLGCMEGFYYTNDNGSTIDNPSEFFHYSETTNRANSIGPQSVISEAEHYYNFDVDSYSGSSSRRGQPGTSRAGNLNQQNEYSYDLNNSKICNQDSSSIPVIQHSNPYLWYMIQQQQQQQQQEPGTPLKPPTNLRYPKYHLRNASISNRAKLTENCELVRIKSNVWGTKFKVINVGHNSTGRDRAVLGSMVYKASILHLQPRRILMNMHIMSNYCSLCSVHHHTSRRAQLLHQMSREQTKAHKNSTATSLLDSPVKHPSSVVRVQKYQKVNEINQSSSQSVEKVVLNIGDGIKVAPKLEWNQQYRISNKYPKQEKTPTASSRNLAAAGVKRGGQMDYNRSTSETHRPKRHGLENRKKVNHNSSGSYSSIDGTCSVSGSSGMKGQMSDDVLTLSLEQGDQIKVEMSSLTGLNSPNRESSFENSRLDDFLATNKTLKSIQTITKMIVDLSSRADDDSPMAGGSNEEELVSPSKLAKGLGGDRIRSPSSKYVAPETPVHKPRRLPGHLQSRGSGSFEQTQSAHSSPRFTRSRDHFGQRSNPLRRDEQHHIPGSYDNPLPPPPLATPIRRRLSATAKRFFDSSLKMIQTNSEQSGGELGAEENEPLVSSRNSRHQDNPLPGQYSQPQTPLRNLFRRDKMSCDIETLRNAVLRKMNNGKEKHKSFNLNQSFSHQDGSLSSSDSLNLDKTSTDSSSSSSMSDGSSHEPEEQIAAKNRNSILSNSLRDLRDFKYQFGFNNNSEKEAAKRRSRRRKRRRKRPLCSSTKCPCAQQIKLSNRTPIWNDQSQVYQLDFDGRVTQESAKNLQIDYEGRLALQFGRLDKCTYTLDYKYPFNAVQAMSVALASLTQRLK